MNKIDCSKVRSEIEEAAIGEILAAPAREHLSNCATCAAFGDEQRKLRGMVASLETIEAPADFDFKLRARLAASRSSRAGLPWGNGFGMRSVAFATLLLLLGFVLVLMNVRSRSNESAPVAQANGAASETSSQPSPAANSLRDSAPNASIVVGAAPQNEVKPAAAQITSMGPNLIKRSGNSAPRYVVARSGRIKATDLSATAAPLFRPTERAMGAYVFPLGTSYQSLKVSVDDGRGSSRTISLPTVSFGSSRVLARNPAPVMVSSRDSW